jgi:DNA/RNA endonuclease YhcR with UshA esterase domain
MKLAKYCGAIAFSLVVFAAAYADHPRVSPETALSHVGETVTVCGIVASAKFAAKSRRQPTFLNLNRPYPDHIFTAVIWGDDRSNFAYPPESLAGKRICVTGTVAVYKGRAEIVVSTESQISRSQG